MSDTDAEVRATGVGGERAPMDHMDCQERKSVIARRRGGMWNMNNMEYRKTRMQQRQAPRKTTSEKKTAVESREERAIGTARHCRNASPMWLPWTPAAPVEALRGGRAVPASVGRCPPATAVENNPKTTAVENNPKTTLGVAIATLKLKKVNR